MDGKEHTKVAPVIVIGMHRSGTTMTTEFLQQSGIFLGDKRNHYVNKESFFFQQINQWILNQYGARWDLPESIQFQSEFQKKNILRVVRKRLSSFETRKYFGGRFSLNSHNLLKYYKNFGWKDPKTTLCIDIWGKIYPNAKIIHIYRIPIDVALSLQKRELHIERHFKPNWKTNLKELTLSPKSIYNQSNRVQKLEEGFKVWEFYTSKGLQANAYFKNVLHLRYEDILSDPKHKLELVTNFCKISPERNLIDNIIRKINVDRKYSFLKNDEGLALYEIIKDHPLMKKLNYNKIID